jgi:hypothetical protein
LAMRPVLRQGRRRIIEGSFGWHWNELD